MTRTVESHELALYIINSDTKALPYAERVNLARMSEKWRDRVPAHTTLQWAGIAKRAATRYEREFGARDDVGKIFSAQDVLLAAAEVADYYERHVQEMEVA